MRIPDNEFSEICTGDMESMDSAWHYWVQDKYKAVKAICEKNWKKFKRYTTNCYISKLI